MNYKLFPENIADFRDEKGIQYMVVTEKNFNNGAMIGCVSSFFSVAIQYCSAYPNDNFVITIL